MKHFLVLSLLLLALPVHAQEAANGMFGSNGQPLSVNADSLEWRQNEKMYVARGKASVTQGNVTLMAETLTAHYVEKPEGGTQINLIEAEGGVHIKGQAQDVYGQRGVYDLNRQVAVLKGDNLQLIMGEDTVTARDTLEFWQQENIAVARGEAKATRGEQIIAGDILTAQLEKAAGGKLVIRKMSAEGNVLVATKDEIARGDRGLYDLKKEQAVLEGNVRITRGPNQLNGAKAIVDLKNGVSRLVAAKGQQVKALMVPNSAPEVKP